MVVSILTGLILLLRAYQHQYSPHPEWVRKLLHMGMGLVTLTFPWLFNSPLPIIALGIGAIAFLCSLKKIPYLHQRLGKVTASVARTSWGELYFPLAIVLVFTFSQENPIYYLIPILILTLADAVAALIGVSYGFHTYSTSEGRKSAEGSIAFFTVAFLSTHIPLLLLTETGRAETLLIALILGLQVMVVEAISWQGLDNLFIPLGGLIMLKLLLPMETHALGFRLVLTLILGTIIFSWRHRTTLNDSAVLGTAWLGYLIWILGNWQWFIPPLVLFLAYSFLCPWTRQYPQRSHDIRAVLSIGATGLFWLLLAKFQGIPIYFYPYTLAFAAHLAIIDIAVPHLYPHLPNEGLITRAIIKGWGLMFIPFLLLKGVNFPTLLFTGVGLGSVIVMVIAFAIVQQQFRARAATLQDYQWTETPLWVSRSLIVGVCSAIALPFLSLYPR